MIPIRDEWALITGAAGGLGAAMARDLARRGARLVLTDLHTAPLEPLAAELRSLGATVITARLDVTDRAAWRDLADALESEGRLPRLLVNNAGIAAVGPALDLSDDAWHRVIDVDLWGVVHGCRTFVPRMRRVGRSAVLNVASASAYLGLPMGAPYIVAKAGVLRLTQSLSAEVDPSEVRFSVLCPGGVDTGITQRGIALGSPSEAASAVGDLLTPPHRSAEQVARKAIRGVLRGRAVINVFWEAWLLDTVSRLVPHGLVGPLGRWYLDGRVRASARPSRAPYSKMSPKSYEHSLE